MREDPFEEIYSRMANWKKTEDKPMCSSAEDPHFRSRYVDPLSACDIKPVRYEEHPEFKGES